MAQHFGSFTELMETAVLPLLKKHPDWIRLDGALKGGNRIVFATFRYQYKTWKIHSDTLIAKLLEAFELETGGEMPFLQAKTEKQNACLHLSNQKTEAPNGLYIYQHED